MSGKDGADKAPEKVVEAPVESSDDVKQVEDASEVDEIASKELAGAIQEAKNDADAAEKAKDGTSVRVDALEAFIETKKESDAKDAEGHPKDEQDALDKQSKEVSERLEAAEKKAEKDDEGK